MQLPPLILVLVTNVHERKTKVCNIDPFSEEEDVKTIPPSSAGIILEKAGSLSPGSQHGVLIRIVMIM